MSPIFRFSGIMAEWISKPLPSTDHVKLKKKILIAVLLFGTFLFLNNTSWFTDPPPGRPWLLAHRGLGQTFPIEGLTAESNTARLIYAPEHPFLENTIPSMEAAFDAGADIVELDIHPTKDGRFAVFHDWTLDFRTDGKGVTREQTVDYLKTLDVGFGYTSDGGETFPFRGKGVGLMPTLDEVFKHFPERRFLVHIKSNDPNEGNRLAEFLNGLPEERLSKIWVYGGDRPIASLKEGLPQVRVFSKSIAKSALLTYLAIGWSGYIPPAMRNSLLFIPLRYAPYLWGWPNLFQQRMAAAGTPFALVGGAGNWSEGFDATGSLGLLPASFSGGIWTNRIDRIAPAFKTGSTILPQSLPNPPVPGSVSPATGSPSGTDR